MNEIPEYYQAGSQLSVRLAHDNQQHLSVTIGDAVTPFTMSQVLAIVVQIAEASLAILKLYDPSLLPAPPRPH